jgi:hypothetical protein
MKRTGTKLAIFLKQQFSIIFTKKNDLTMDFDFPSIFKSCVRNFWIFGSACHKLAGVANARDVIQSAQRHVAVGTGLKSLKLRDQETQVFSVFSGILEKNSVL